MPRRSARRCDRYKRLPAASPTQLEVACIEKERFVSGPVSRVLSLARSGMEAHAPVATISLRRRSLDACRVPVVRGSYGPAQRHALAAYPEVLPDRTGPLPTSRDYFLFGLAPGGVCQAKPITRPAGALLPHRFTLTGKHCSPAVCFLLHFPEPCGRWTLSTTLSYGARTFLPPRTAYTRAENRPHPRLSQRSPGPLTNRFYCTISTRSRPEMFMGSSKFRPLGHGRPVGRNHQRPPGILSDMSKNQAPSIFLNFWVSL